jgi:hypothetical protein
MKTNLPASLIHWLKSTKLPLGFSLLCLVLALNGGCSSTAPSAVESYLFTTTTNYTPEVHTILTTNTAGIVTANVQTNLLPTVTSSPSVALQSWAGLASGVANTISPGSGGIVGLSLLGIAGFFGLNRQRKLTEAVRVSEGHESAATTAQALAENFAQSIEVLREVLKTTPQGQALDVKIVDMLQRNQMTVGIIREAVGIVENTVSNAAAKATAQKILALLPAA